MYYLFILYRMIVDKLIKKNRPHWRCVAINAISINLTFFKCEMKPVLFLGSFRHINGRRGFICNIQINGRCLFFLSIFKILCHDSWLIYSAIANLWPKFIPLAYEAQFVWIFLEGQHWETLLKLTQKYAEFEYAQKHTFYFKSFPELPKIQSKTN